MNSMKISKMSTEKVVLIYDNDEDFVSVPCDWLLDKNTGNTPAYFYASSNGSKGGGIAIEHSKVTHLIKDGVETDWTGNADALYTELCTNFFANATGDFGIKAKLNINSKGVVFGDSWATTAFGLLNGNNIYYSEGYAAQVLTHLGHKLYFGLKSNQGVSGNRTDQALARINQLMDTKPDVILNNIGVNDVIQNRPIEAIKKDLTSIYELQKTTGAIILDNTIPNTYLGAFFTAPQQLLRAQINEFKKAYTGIIAVDLDALLTNASYFQDALHVNGLGSFVTGKEIARVLMPFFNFKSNDLSFQINPLSVPNFELAGNDAGRATGWNLDVNLFGSMITPSKIIVNGMNRQVLT
ncbi:MAG: hypothetical protein EOO07_27690, partial [Chitinophagaceae bacterium]